MPPRDIIAEDVVVVKKKHIMSLGEKLAFSSEESATALFSERLKNQLVCYCDSQILEVLQVLSTLNLHQTRLGETATVLSKINPLKYDLRLKERIYAIKIFDVAHLWLAGALSVPDGETYRQNLWKFIIQSKNEEGVYFHVWNRRTFYKYILDNVLISTVKTEQRGQSAKEIQFVCPDLQDRL